MALEPTSEPAWSAPADALGPYLNAVRRHWRLVLSVTVLAVLIASITVERSSESYSATASILVTPLPAGDSGFVGIGTVVDSGDPARAVQTAAALVDTPDAAARAAQSLGKGWTAGRVSAAVSVAPLGASDVLAVTATAPTAAEAQRVATAYARGAIAYRASVVQSQIASSIQQLQARLDQLGSGGAGSAQAAALASGLEQLRSIQGTGREPTLSLSQTAGAATTNGASKALILLLALIGGFAVASVAALALETFSRPVRDREEITSLFPVPVLAALPVVPGANRLHGVPPWDLPPHVFEQIRMLRVQLSLAGTKRVVMVTSAGVGDGKTTVAAALAAAFSEAGRTVTVMDLDLRKPHLAELLGVNPSSNGTTQRTTRGGAHEVPRLPGVKVVPAPSGGLPQFEALAGRLPTILDQARKDADLVIVDAAPVGEVSEALRVATMCDDVIFVAHPRRTDRRRLVLARDLLQRAGKLPIGLVLVGETGLPRAHESYAYAMSPMEGNGVGRGHPVAESAAVTRDADGVEADPARGPSATGRPRAQGPARKP
ncbi:MAG: P-loop NTPase [Solirubrobacteraceae bacterium]